jgi:hypothetical protein
MTNFNLAFSRKGIVGSTGVVATHDYIDFNSPWGLAAKCHHDCLQELAVACNGSGVVFRLDPCGNARRNPVYTQDAALTAPGSPTGVVYYCGDGFPIAGSTGITGSSRLIIAQSNGIISGFNDDVNQVYAVNVVGPTGSFTGLAFHDSYLYAANSGNGAIYKYDESWNWISAYTDPSLPALVPSNVALIEYRGCKVLVAPWVVNGSTASPPGQGFLNLLNSDGTVTRLIDAGQLSVPWAVFNLCIDHQNYIGVGNNGNGTVVIYDEHGQFLTEVNNIVGKPFIFGAPYGVVPAPEKAVIYVASGVEGQGLLDKLTAR